MMDESNKSALETLPLEIKYKIFGYVMWRRPLKNLSMVNKKFNREVRPFLLNAPRTLKSAVYDEVLVQPEVQPQTRGGHVAALYDDNIIVYGGNDEDGNVFNSHLWIFNITNGQWTKHEVVGELTEYVVWSSSWVHNDHLYLFGGCYYNYDYLSNDVHRLDLTTYYMVKLNPGGNPPSPREGMCTRTIGDDVVVFGGWDSSYNNDVHVLKNFSGDCVWYQPTCTGVIPSQRAYAAFTQVGDVGYMFGGRGRGGVLNDMYALNLKSFVWTEVEQKGTVVPSKRCAATLTAVDSCNLFLCGGWYGSTLNDCHMYNIVNKEWTQVQLPGFEPRYRHTTCCDDDDQLIVFGGWGKIRKALNTIGWFRFDFD